MVSELVALIALQGPYIEKTNGTLKQFSQDLKEIQAAANKYHALVTAQNSIAKGPAKDKTLEEIAIRLKDDETSIRNPGLPEHHLQLSGELFGPLNDDIKKLVGFNVDESIILRKDILRLIQYRWEQVQKEADQTAYHLAKQVYHYRNSRTVPKGTEFTIAQLDELATYSRKEIRNVCLQKKVDQFLDRVLFV